MVYFAGWQGRVNWWGGTTNYSAIGAVAEFNAEMRATVARDDGISTRKRYANRIVEIRPTWDMRYSPQDFNFIQNIFRTNETNMSKFNLRVFDGREYVSVINCFANTMNIEVAHGRDVQITVDGLAENMSSAESAHSYAAQLATPPISFRQVTAVTVVGSSLVTDFRRFNINLNNNVTPDITGNVVTPADLLEGKCDYTGTIEIAKKLDNLFPTQVNSSNGIVAFALQDRAASPVTATFNFADCAIMTNRVQVPTGLVIQRIDWGSNNLSLTVA